MNLKKYLLAPLLIVGLIACNRSEDVPGETIPEGLPTYVNISVQLPSSVAGKALPEDYNPDGEYEGNDGVETLDIYMIAGDGTIEAKRFAGTGISSDGAIVSPSQPFRTTSGIKTIYVVLNNPGPLGTTVNSDNDLVPVTGLAEIVTQNGVAYDVITMTGKSSSVAIEPDISETAVLGGANHITVQVVRMASRVIVTTTANNELRDSEGTLLGTMSDLTYSVAQGTNQIYFIQQPDYITYGYNYVPELGEYTDQASQYYDYSDLSNPSPIPALPTAGDGYKSLPGKFLFENTHQTGTRATTGYRKGNTAYVLVRTTFTPQASAIADGGTLTNGTFYVGQADGRIYSSKQAAQAAVQNQRVAVYLEGKMLYYAWLNPDNIQAPLNSPVVRNNIYHINITGFGQLGVNWNPLYPEDPNTTDPDNPDPKPVNPDEPESPVDPIDPLTPEQTYMTVEVTVLNWTVHSYDIEF
ncbi:MAG: Mfa1 family fimbria major subunit [Tannerellaceae bacterium]|nr:Mfa1 family fimbria major subunit [Tannerellaceae bacterium]